MTNYIRWTALTTRPVCRVAHYTSALRALRPPLHTTKPLRHLTLMLRYTSYVYYALLILVAFFHSLYSR